MAGKTDGIHGKAVVLMLMEKTMRELALGENAWVKEVNASGALGGRLLDLGLMKGCKVTCLFPSALGDPRAYAVCGAVVALRDRDAELVKVVTEEAGL